MAKAMLTDTARAEAAQPSRYTNGISNHLGAELEGVACLLEQSMAVMSLISSSLEEADNPHVQQLNDALIAARSLIETATARLDKVTSGEGDDV